MGGSLLTWGVFKIGRIVTCQICKSKINSDEAYKIEHVSSKGRSTNKYYCNENEFRQRESDVHFWKQCQLGIDYIIGYKCINNSKNKMLKEILESGYTREELYDCIKERSTYIQDCLAFRQDIENEQAKLFYIFAILKSSIKEITEANKLSEKIIIINQQIEEEPECVIPASKQVINKRKTLSERLKGE